MWENIKVILFWIMIIAGTGIFIFIFISIARFNPVEEFNSHANKIEWQILLNNCEKMGH